MGDIVNLRLAFLAALAAAPGFAQAAAAPDELETVVVTATRSAQQQNRLPAAVTIITRDDIEKSGATHIVQVLRAAGALQVTEFFGDGSRASVDVRGFGEGAHSTTLILVDGRRLNNSDIAPPDLNSVALKDIERIEIIQGSAGVLYGDQAVGGIVNIVTRGVPRSSATLEGGGGSYGALRARAAAAQRWDAWSLRLSAEGRGSDNYRDHNRLEYKNALLRLGFDGAGAAVSLEGGWIDEDLETPGALYADEVAQDRRQSTPNFSQDFSDTDTGLGRLRWRQRLGSGWEIDTDVDHRDSYGTFRLSSAAFGPSGADSTQERGITGVHPRLVGTFPAGFGDGLLTAGLDALQAEYELRSPFGVQANDQRQLDAYAQLIVPLPGHVEVTVGGRSARVDNDVYDGFTFAEATRFDDREDAGSAGLSWRPTAMARFFTRYDRNFRFAKVDEFTNAGAPPGSGIVNLRTQTGDSYEAGSELGSGPVQVRATLYRLELEDEIVFDPTAFTFGANVNLDVTRRDGVIIETDLTAGSVVIGARYHRVDANITGGALTGKDIPLVAPETAKLIVRADLPAGLTAYAELLGIDRRPLAGDFDNSQSRLPGHAVTNLSLGWRDGSLALDARVNNLLDAQYAEYGASAADPMSFAETGAYFPSPERNLQASIRYDW